MEKRKIRQRGHEMASRDVVLSASRPKSQRRPGGRNANILLVTATLFHSPKEPIPSFDSAALPRTARSQVPRWTNPTSSRTPVKSRRHSIPWILPEAVEAGPAELFSRPWANAHSQEWRGPGSLPLDDQSMRLHSREGLLSPVTELAGCAVRCLSLMGALR